MRRFPVPAQRALMLRGLNAAGTVLQSLGLQRPRFDSEKLLELGAAETGLNDFGPPSCREGLQVLCQAFEEQARLSQVGRLAMFGLLKNSLVTRLKIIDYLKHSEASQQQQITSPLIICGMPRTGTSILHEMLALDPGLRAPLTWEVSAPFPLPNAADHGRDPRIAAAAKNLRLTDKLVPMQRYIHKMGAELPQECVAILASHFASEQYSTTCHLPAYRDWLLQQDMCDAYSWHAQYLKYLQCGRGFGQRRWLLKTPVHLFFLPTLLQQYPDALVIHTHRAPRQILRSVCSLVCNLRIGFSNRVYPEEVVAEEIPYYAEMMRRTVKDRAKLPKKQFFDVFFEQLKGDFMGVVEQIYRHFELELKPALKTRMEQYLAADRALAESGRHNPDRLFDDWNLNSKFDEAEDLFANYCRHFDLKYA